MKKKLIGALLVLSCVSMLAACGGKTDEVSNKNDKQVTSEVEKTTKEEVEEEVEPTEEPTPTEVVSEYPTTEQLTEAMHNQFANMENYTMKMYVSTNATAYTDADLYMAMGKSGDINYTYIANYLEAYMEGDTIYYYDAAQEKWFTDDYDSSESGLTMDEDADSIKDQTFPEDTVIENRDLNGTTYIAAIYKDSDEYQSEVVYYFDDDLNFIAAGSEMTGSTEMSEVESGYLFMTLDTDKIEIPEEALNAEKGNYEEYMMNAFMSMYNVEDDGSIYTPDDETTVEEEDTTKNDKELDSTSVNKSEGHKKNDN